MSIEILEELLGIFMKKIAMLLTIITFVANPAFAQQKGKAAATSSKTASDGNFAWGIGLGALAALGVVVGITVSSATESPSTFSH